MLLFFGLLLLIGFCRCWHTVDIFCYANREDLLNFKSQRSEYPRFDENKCYRLYGDIWYKRDLLGNKGTYSDSGCSNPINTIDVSHCIANDVYLMAYDPGTWNQYDREFKNCWDRGFKYYGFWNPVSCTSNTMIEYSPELKYINQTYQVVDINFETNFQNAISRDLEGVCQAEFTGTNAKIKDQFTGMSSTLTSEFGKMTTKINSHFNSIDSSLTSETNKVTSKINSEFNGINSLLTGEFSKINTKVSGIDTKIKTHITQFDNALSDQTTKISNELNQQDQMITDHEIEMAKVLTQQHQNFTDLISNQMDQFKSLIGDSDHVFHAECRNVNINGSLEVFRSEVIDKIENLELQLNQMMMKQMQMTTQMELTVNKKMDSSVTNTPSMKIDNQDNGGGFGAAEILIIIVLIIQLIILAMGFMIIGRMTRKKPSVSPIQMNVVPDSAPMHSSNGVQPPPYKIVT